VAAKSAAILDRHSTRWHAGGIGAEDDHAWQQRTSRHHGTRRSSRLPGSRSRSLYRSPGTPIGKSIDYLDFATINLPAPAHNFLYAAGIHDERTLRWVNKTWIVPVVMFSTRINPSMHDARVSFIVSSIEIGVRRANRLKFLCTSQGVEYAKRCKCLLTAVVRQALLDSQGAGRLFRRRICKPIQRRNGAAGRRQIRKVVMALERGVTPRMGCWFH